jgi:Flp pilus assembly pilin Flp
LWINQRVEDDVNRKLSTRALHATLVRLFRDESGGEVIEYVLIAGLIIVATITTIAAMGTKVMARWTSVNASM